MSEEEMSRQKSTEAFCVGERRREIWAPSISGWIVSSSDAMDSWSCKFTRPQAVEAVS